MIEEEYKHAKTMEGNLSEEGIRQYYFGAGFNVYREKYSLALELLEDLNDLLISPIGDASEIIGTAWNMINDNIHKIKR